jgi:hypothetical protein
MAPTDRLQVALQRLSKLLWRALTLLLERNQVDMENNLPDRLYDILLGLELG